MVWTWQERGRKRSAKFGGGRGGSGKVAVIWPCHERGTGSSPEDDGGCVGSRR